MLIDTPTHRMWPGRVITERVADLTIGATAFADAGFEVSQGTATYTTPPNDAGTLSVATAATIAAVAEIRTTTTFNLGHYKMLAFCVEAFSTSSNTTGTAGDIDVFMMMTPDSANNAGVSALHFAASAKGVIRTYSTGAVGTDTNSLEYMRGTHRRTLTLMIFPPTQSVYLLHGPPQDGWVASARENVTTMAATGAVRPRMQLVTKTAAARSFSIRQARLMLVRN